MRLRTCCAVLFVLAAVAHGAEKKPAPKEAYFKGKVVSLAALLKGEGVVLDADASSTALALQAEDGKVYPLAKNDGSRMFFKDKGLLGRPVRLTGRLVGGLLDVREAHTYVGGKLHEAYYWCANCALAYSEPGACLCCGELVKLVEVEVTAPPAKPVERLLPKD
jgi:hypothetical protein